MADKVYLYDNSLPLQYWFHCPGCKHDHAFTVGERRSPDDPRWTFNGSMDKPSFQPSLLCNKDYPDSRCHSFVTDGNIQFLGDCWHALAGQTVELPDWKDAQELETDELTKARRDVAELRALNANLNSSLEQAEQLMEKMRLAAKK